MDSYANSGMVTENIPKSDKFLPDKFGGGHKVAVIRTGATEDGEVILVKVPSLVPEPVDPIEMLNAAKEQILKSIDPYKGNQRRTRGPSVPAPPIKPGRVKTGRNDPCPCGSGKKFKKCCLNQQ